MSKKIMTLLKFWLIFNENTIPVQWKKLNYPLECNNFDMFQWLGSVQAIIVQNLGILSLFMAEMSHSEGKIWVKIEYMTSKSFSCLALPSLGCIIFHWHNVCFQWYTHT